MGELTIFGTELEELDEQQKDVISRKPLGVREEVVRDEQGRRRFHGAFTGGFSAGYFNTVGSKEGWTPSQFRSSKDNRGERVHYKIEDFMDEEDLGEFGIAARRIRTSLEGKSKKQPLAWERLTESTLEEVLASKIDCLIRPVKDCVGVRLLKKMGWREGQGIGPKLSRKSLEKQKQHEKNSYGQKSDFDLDAVNEANEMAPDFQFAPHDVSGCVLRSRNELHGLGYEGLKQSSVLSEEYGTLEAALKTKEKSKGIRGQAFGVGAFEDEDANIYTNYDLSQYDFAIGGDDYPSTSHSSYDSTFIMAERRQGARPFFEPPRLPTNFHAIHTPILVEISKLPESVRKCGEKMTHVQRAQFLGEVDKNAIMELIHDEDRKRLASRWGPKSDANSDFGVKAFEDEPMKQSRFKQFVQYLKRGLDFPQPAEMTTLEWERELAEFHSVLPPQFRSLLPEVKLRQKPLAKVELAAPIAEILKSKFVSSGHDQKRRDVKDEDCLAAVRMKMFGEMTRQTHEWHPCKQLAKRFNVPDPYPSSNLVGVPHLQKAVKTENLLNLGSTAQELNYLAERSRREETAKTNETQNDKEVYEEHLGGETSEDAEALAKALEKAPDDLLKAIFGDSDEENDSVSETSEHDEETEKSEREPSIMEPKREKQPSPIPKFVTVMDIAESGEEFGPAPPPPSSGLSLPQRSVIREYLKHQERKEKRRKKKRSDERRRKRRKKDKHKHKISRKRDRSDDRSSSITSTE